MSDGSTASAASAGAASSAAGAGFPPPPPPPGPPPLPGGDPGAGPGAAPRDTPRDLGWMGDLQGMARAARGMVSGRLLLLSLELRSAQQGLFSLAILLVVAAIAGATAWIALWAGLAALAVQLGLSWPWACAAVLGANVLLLLWVVAAMKALAPMLALPASRRQFHWLFNDPMDTEDPPADGRHATPT